VTFNSLLKTLGLSFALSGSLFAGAAAAASDLPVSGTVDPVTGFQTTSSAYRHSMTMTNGFPVITAQGTQVVTATITVNGTVRSYDIIKPTTTVANPSVVLLLHAHGISPELQANISLISDYVMSQQFWAVLPAAVNKVWGDDPSKDSNADVQFISQLIDTLVAQGANSSKIYASGFSNGAFMTERLACELSDKIAAFSIVSATMRTGLQSSCQPAVQRSKAYFLGTADTIVPYSGSLDMTSAASTISFWSSQQHCAAVTSTSLPTRSSSYDQTSVQLDSYSGCTNGSSLQLYSINGGGHAWPGGLPTGLGATTYNISADGLMWLLSSNATI